MKLAAFIFSCLAAMCVRAQRPTALELKATIPLPGVEGRFDHAAYDAKTHRLFFAALGNNTLEVVDVETARRVHAIAGLKKPTGVLFLAEWNSVVVAGGDDGTCRFYDGGSYAEKGRVSEVPDADNLRFDSKARRIYLGYGEGALGVIDPATMKLTGTIPLLKHPESFQLETNGARLFVNVPDARQIAVVDRTVGKVTATWRVDDAKANFPMALDEGQNRLFIGCRQPARLLVFDTQSGKRSAETPMSGDVDDLFFQAATNRVFASCGEGFVDVFHCDRSGSLQREQKLPTAAGARTCFLFAAENWLCLAVPHRGTQGAELRIYTTESNRHQ